MEITRRQLLGASLGLVGTGLAGRNAAASVAAPASPGSPGAAAFSILQTTEGRRVTSGRTVRARYLKPVRRGSLLVAVVSRLSTASLAATVGQVTDDQGNHWRQALEYFTGDHYGVDIWYCESAGGGNRPNVTATCLGYPVYPGTSGMRMTLLEYWGAQGFELCDQICQADITGTSVTATTNFGLTSDNELAITAIVGDMSAAVVPSGWNSRLADAQQGCYIADTLSSGGSSAGSQLRATWAGLAGGHTGAAVLATFVPRGVSAQSRRLVQSSYTDSAILRSRGHPTWRSQPYPVDPTPGNTLVAFMNGAIFYPQQATEHTKMQIDCGSIVALKDSAGNHWYKAGESGPDNHTGINISCWVCDSAVGGPTTLMPTFSNASQQLACLLLEFENLPPGLRVETMAQRTYGQDLPPLTTGTSVSAGDIALAYRTDIYRYPQGPGSPAWKQIMSDTTGANALMMLDTPAEVLTADWSGQVVLGGLDILLLALTAGEAG